MILLLKLFLLSKGKGVGTKDYARQSSCYGTAMLSLFLFFRQVNLASIHAGQAMSPSPVARPSTFSSLLHRLSMLATDSSFSFLFPVMRAVIITPQFFRVERE